MVTKSTHLSCQPVRVKNEPLFSPLHPPPIVARKPLADRYGLNWRKWLRDRAEESPCWLASLLLHMVLLVLLGSMVVATNPNSGLRPLLLSFTTATDVAVAASPVVLQSHPNADAVPSPPIGQAVVVEETLDQPSRPFVPMDLPDNTPKTDVPTGNAALSAGTIGQAAPRPDDPLELPIVASPPPESRSPDATPVDDQVDRFIEFDIGKLRGPEGEQARREFHALGPNSIPALVRGLNKSARIAASCPVVVIGGKLENELRNTNNTALLRYAIDNIGRDVPADAPHLARLKKLRDQLMGQRRIALALKVEGADVELTARLTAALDRLADKPADELLRAMEQPAWVTQLAALITVLDRHAQFSDRERPSLSRAAVRMLDDHHEATRQYAHRVLVALANGPDYGPAEAAGPAAIFAAQSDWRDHWKQAETQRLRDAEAERLFRSAQRLESQNRGMSAMAAYRRLIADYAESPVAASAKARLQAMQGK